MTMSAARADATLTATLGGGATPHLQFHTGDPGVDGTANVMVQDDGTTASPRKPITFGAPENHATNIERRVLSTDAPEWTGVEANTGQSLTHFTIWSALTAGQVEHIAPLTEAKTTGSDGVRANAGDIEAAITVHAKPA